MFIYGYSDLLLGLEDIKKKADVFSIGRSCMGRHIICIKLGKGKRKVFINGAHHAGESITSALVLRFAEDLNGELSYLLENNSVFMVPMVNPDGVELVKRGSIGFHNREFLIDANNGKTDFSLWQANARGVDLNHNYDAGWNVAKQMEGKYGIYKPSPTRFGGDFPESEPETKAMVRFTKCEGFDVTLSYHTQGKEIYYTYGCFTPKESYSLAQKMADASGYVLSEPSGIASYGGYKDWFIKTFKKPGFTIEAGLGRNPLPYTQLDEIYNDNKGLLKAVLG